MNPLGRPPAALRQNSLVLYERIAKGGLFEATDIELSNLTGFSARSVSRYLAWLRKNGYIDIQVTRRKYLEVWTTRRKVVCKIINAFTQIGASDGVHEEQVTGQDHSHSGGSEGASPEDGTVNHEDYL